MTIKLEFITDQISEQRNIQIALLIWINISQFRGELVTERETRRGRAGTDDARLRIKAIRCYQPIGQLGVVSLFFVPSISHSPFAKATTLAYSGVRSRIVPGSLVYVWPNTYSFPWCGTGSTKQWNREARNVGTALPVALARRCKLELSVPCLPMLLCPSASLSLPELPDLSHLYK